MKFKLRNLCLLIFISPSCSHDTMEDKKIIEHYPDGQKKFEVNRINGEWWGKYKEWFPNGLRKEESRYENGILNGSFNSWFENGNKQISGTFIHGEIVNKYLEFHEGGSLYLDLNFNGEGNFSGIQKGFYSSGLPFFSFETKVDEKYGEITSNSLKIYHPNGIPVIECEFDDQGNLSGPFFERNEEGDVMLKGYFESGARASKWSFFPLYNASISEIERAIINSHTEPYKSLSFLFKLKGTGSSFYYNSPQIPKFQASPTIRHPMLTGHFVDGSLHGPWFVYGYGSGRYIPSYSNEYEHTKYVPRLLLIFENNKLSQSSHLEENWHRNYLKRDDISDEFKNIIRNELNLEKEEKKGLFRSIFGL